MSFQEQPPPVAQLPPAADLRRKRWGKVLFFALTLASVFLLCFTGWSTLSARQAFAAHTAAPAQRPAQ